MAKPEKRQMIILGLTAIVILYAAVDFLMPKRRETAVDIRQQTEELNSFITTLAAGMGKDTSKNLLPLIFSRADKEWTKDPFLDATSYKSWVQVKAPIKEGGTAAPKIEFVYAGYLEVDKKRIAIINGVEYTEGEALDIKGFVLKTVSPTKVVIENRGTRALLNVPLQE
jgi:hypothetical protein